MSSYLTELGDNLKQVDSVIKTGNVLADAIINSKISSAKSKRFRCGADAHIPVKLTISDVDLCVILGNLFENVIEANRQLPEGQRMIQVNMDMKGNQLNISFPTIRAMTGTLAVLKTLQSYIDQNSRFVKIQRRIDLLLQIILKGVAPTYPNVEKSELENE